MPKFKLGVHVPHNPKDTVRLDKVNNDNLLEGAMDKEIGSINTFKIFIILEENEHIPTGYKRIPYHMIFDVKFDGRRKARLVARAHRAPEVHIEEIHSGVVSMETIRTAFVLASLNNLEVCAADVSTAFLYGGKREKVYFIAGDEISENKGKIMLIDKGLYGLASSSS